MTAPVGDPGRHNWVELVPHEPGRLILSILAFRDFLVRLERKDGLPRIVVRDRGDGVEHVIGFEEEAFSLGLSGSLEFDTTVMRFSYSSMTTPSQLFDYATPRDGTAPCLLYGYGSYGITIPAAFNTNCLSLVDRGFVYAIAHVRGGKDKGFSWYEDGKRAKKANTFRDFIAVARHLVAERYTAHDRIVAQGGSAGGMLMGAVANMAPEAFGAIVAEVPFVDVLTTMLDATLPLTPPEWPGWVNPVASQADYRTIAAESP